MASIASSLGSSDPTTASSPTSASNALTTNALGNETTFLQLMVAEIKNQDPTAPMDSTTFLTQLAQFSQLEQVAGIRQDIETGNYSTPSSAVNPTTSDAAANAAAQDPSNTAPTTPASTSGI